MRGMKERVGGAKERAKEALSQVVGTLGPSGWLAGATRCRSPVVTEAKVGQAEHVPI